MTSHSYNIHRCDQSGQGSNLEFIWGRFPRSHPFPFFAFL